MTTRVLIMAHRGYKTPENSMEAFHNAIDINADYIEFDIHLTKDHIFVVHHDSAFTELGDNRPITSLTMSEIESLELPNGEPIPRLEQVIKEISPKIGLNIELKTPTAGKELVSFLQKHPPKSSYIVSSFHEQALLDIHQETSEIPLAYLFVHTIFKRRITKALQLHANWINPYYRFCTKSLINNAHKNKIQVNPWTVNNLKTQLKLIKQGVDSIITDEPKTIINELR